MHARDRAHTGIASQGCLTFDEYFASVRNDGPQVRGYQPADFDRVLAHDRTRYMTFLSNGMEKRWPVLADMRLNSEYVPDYFRRRYGEGTPVYYLSLPDLRTVDHLEEVRRTLAAHIGDLSHVDARIVIDQQVGVEDHIGFVREVITSTFPGALIEQDDFLDPRNETPAEAVYFHVAVRTGYQGPHTALPATPSLLREAYHHPSEPSGPSNDETERTVILDALDLDRPLPDANARTMFDQVWEIYSSRFDELTEHYPVRGSQTREELETMLHNPSTVTFAHGKGTYVHALTYAADIDVCEWLNRAYYQRTFPDAMLLYLPGIATRRECRGQNASFGLINLICRLCRLSVPRLHLVFQCTNISSTYLPRIIAAGIQLCGLKLEAPIATIASYRCASLRTRLA